MTNKLGDKVKEIRIKNGLSQEALAKELGYNSRSTINKIEKGINEISYEKFMLLIKKYDYEMDELLDKNYKDTFNPINDDSTIYISFSGRDKGNSYDIAHHIMKKNDKYIAFKDIFYNACTKCNYECFDNVCKYRYDDLYDLFNSSIKYKKIVLIVPMYCSNPSSLFFIFNERMQDYFNHNSEKWIVFQAKLNIIAIYGSDEETPLFISTLLGLLDGNENKILKIQRHKYNLKMKDRIIKNDDIVNTIKEFI